MSSMWVDCIHRLRLGARGMCADCSSTIAMEAIMPGAGIVRCRRQVYSNIFCCERRGHERRGAPGPCWIGTP